MHIFKTLKSLRHDSEVFPLELPKIPALPDHEMSEEEKTVFKQRFDNFEKQFYKVQEENKKRFRAALPRIILCSHLHGLLNPFGDFGTIREKHYSWCPSKAWDVSTVQHPQTETAS